MNQSIKRTFSPGPDNPSNRGVRLLVGILAFALPIILLIFSMLQSDCSTALSSISDYYHSAGRDIFVGVISCVGFFLLCYPGYDMRDQVVSKIAGFAAIGVIAFPTDSCFCDICQHVFEKDISDVTGFMHLLSAGFFFLMLIVFCLYLFRLSDGPTSIQKQKRNRIYLWSGIAMIACIVGILLFFQFGPKYEEVGCDGTETAWIYWLESFALWAFSISWLTKAQVICGDERS